MKINKFVSILAFSYIAIAITLPLPSYAYSDKEDQKIQDARENAAKENEKNENKIKWELHRSITGIFDTKFPKKYKYRIFPFQFNSNTIAFSAEIYSSLDGLSSQKKEKSIFIKSTQTFGNELTYNDVKKILARESKKYKYYAQAIDGVILTNEDIKHNGFIGKDIYIAYKIDGKKYGLRTIIYMTNYSKIEQVLSGPGHTMYSYRSDDFFDSIILHDGITKKKNSIGAGWIDYTSKNNIFTVTLPPKNKDYTPKPPISYTNSRGDVIKFEIIDPVLEKSVNYNVYSYGNSEPLTNKKVKELLFTNHVSKYVKNAGMDNLQTENTIDGNTKTMRTKLIITPNEKYPGVTTIFFKAIYRGNILVIQEFSCSKEHSNSKLHKTLFSLLKFHPEKYKPVKKTKKIPKETPAKKK